MVSFWRWFNIIYAQMCYYSIYLLNPSRCWRNRIERFFSSNLVFDFRVSKNSVEGLKSGSGHFSESTVFSVQRRRCDRERACVCVRERVCVWERERERDDVRLRKEKQSVWERERNKRSFFTSALSSLNGHIVSLGDLFLVEATTATATTTPATTAAATAATSASTTATAATTA